MSPRHVLQVERGPCYQGGSDRALKLEQGLVENTKQKCHMLGKESFTFHGKFEGRITRGSVLCAPPALSARAGE